MENHFTDETEHLNNDQQPIFIKSEQAKSHDNSLDYSKEYELPTIKTRYISTLIDFFLVLLISLGISIVFEKMGEVSGLIKGLTFILVFVLYEPILISFGCTVGQLITNIRVREMSNPEKHVQLYNAIPRFIIKAILGWISFISITLNVNRRAIHDFMTNTIVIVPKS